MQLGRTVLAAALAVGVVFGASAASAGEVDVVDVKATRTGANTYSFDVTLKHADTGWKHYANKWEIVGPGGKVLGTRVLYHPHVNEQPFTRSLSGVKIDASISEVEVRAYDSQHGAGGKTFKVTLPK